MKKKTAVWALGVFAFVLLAVAGCTANKHLVTIEEQRVQLEQANKRISELEQSNEALTKNLQDAKSDIEGVRQTIGTLKDKIAALEKEKADLAAAVAAGKESGEALQKRTRSLNSQIGALRRELAEREALVASKDAEISSSRQTSEAALQAAAEERDRTIAAVNSEKADLASQMEETVSGKNRTVTILAILLGLAVILAIFGFVRGRKRGVIE